MKATNAPIFALLALSTLFTYFAMSLPTLVLTPFIKESERPGIFIGRINEISGIFAQGNSPEEVYDNLVTNTAIMLPLKQKEALVLLRTQNQSIPAEEAEGKVRFRHEVRELTTA